MSKEVHEALFDIMQMYIEWEEFDHLVDEEGNLDDETVAELDEDDCRIDHVKRWKLVEDWRLGDIRERKLFSKEEATTD